MANTRRNKKIKTESNITRKASRNMCDDEFALWDRESVIEFLQTGGDHTSIGLISKRRKRVNELILMLENLGWNSIFLNNVFKRLDDTLLNEYPLNLFIIDYFKAHIYRIKFITSLHDALTLLGLNTKIINVLIPLLEPLRNSSYTDKQILETCIFYLLGHYKPLTPVTTKYLIQGEKVDAWQVYNTCAKNIEIYNISQVCSYSTYIQLERAIDSNPPPHGHSYYYHTTSWRGSLNIIDGVDRLVGRRCLDFGIYPGFYLSETLTDCLDWASKKNKLWGNETAIIIFTLPHILPTHLSYTELNGKLWSDVTKGARMCKNTQELPTIRNIDLLYGNMVSNTNAVENGTALPMPHRPPKKQLVSKSDAADTFLHTCLTSCIYFKKI